MSLKLLLTPQERTYRAIMSGVASKADQIQGSEKRLNFTLNGLGVAGHELLESPPAVRRCPN